MKASDTGESTGRPGARIGAGVAAISVSASTMAMNCPGSMPGSPHEESSSPLGEYLWMRALPYPSLMKMLPSSVTTMVRNFRTRISSPLRP